MRLKNINNYLECGAQQRGPVEVRGKKSRAGRKNEARNLAMRPPAGKVNANFADERPPTLAACNVPSARPMCYFPGLFPTLEKLMALDRTDVDKIAHLARLAIPEQTKDRLANDLSNILALMEQMGTVDTAGVEPMAHPLHMTQRLRLDQASEADQRAHFQAIAPQTENGLYLVPKVIE